jgi:hypothetical protein
VKEHLLIQKILGFGLEVKIRGLVEMELGFENDAIMLSMCMSIAE